MNFEVINPDSSRGPDEPGPRCRFTLEQGALAGRTHTANFRICPNPCCPCEAIGFDCSPADMPEARLRFSLNVRERQLMNEAGSPAEAEALARAFVAEVQPAHWDWLQSVFLGARRRQLETMDLDTLQVDWPDDVLAADGTMVGYAETFPWAEAFVFSHAGVEWVADDQYCVMPACKCTKAGITFFRRKKPDTAVQGSEGHTFLHLDHRTGEVVVVESKPGNPAPGSLVDALRTACPALLDTLRHRHGQLRRLGRRLLPGKRRRSRARPPLPAGLDLVVDDLLPPSTPPAPVRAEPKVGRNDPCPCGSGLKFKKCCGSK